MWLLLVALSGSGFLTQLAGPKARPSPPGEVSAGASALQQFPSASIFADPLSSVGSCEGLGCDLSLWDFLVSCSYP